MNKEKEFLKEYEKLCQKYNMGLQGCGCCGSPFLNEIDEINYNQTLNKIFIGGDGFWHEKYPDKNSIKSNIIHSKKEIERFLKTEKTIETYFKEVNKESK